MGRNFPENPYGGGMMNVQNVSGSVNLGESLNQIVKIEHIINY
uniref:Uncharacterized protein n=1 Tax=Heterorhabditis bacteriophora TaxID=37862 RepID=A0A1I7X2A5_HETBA